jgi:hypothetical protein
MVGLPAISLDIATEGIPMTDLLIRDVPDDVLAAIDAKAQRIGLSRSEYLRRALARERAGNDADVTVEDLSRFADTFADLADVDIMRQAWE